jgi:hypothetical protein
MLEENKNILEDKQTHFRKNILGSKSEILIWIFSVTVISFIFASTISYLSYTVLKDIDILFAFILLIIIILINIIADIIGTSVTAADEAPFHAMASRRIYGAKRTMKLIRNADKVANLCSDVIGDICGVISGTLGAYIAIRLIFAYGELSLVEYIITGVVAALTVGGKAAGKYLAIKKSNYIIFRVGIILHFLLGPPNQGKKKRQNGQNGSDSQ